MVFHNRGCWATQPRVITNDCCTFSVETDCFPSLLNIHWVLGTEMSHPILKYYVNCLAIFCVTCCLTNSIQIAKTLGLNSIKHRSETKVLDRCLIKVGSMSIFAIRGQPIFFLNSNGLWDFEIQVQMLYLYSLHIISFSKTGWLCNPKQDSCAILSVDQTRLLPPAQR